MAPHGDVERAAGTETAEIVVRLATAERQLAELQEWGRVGFWELDLDTSDVYWSTQAFKIIRLETASLRGFLDIVHPDDRELIDHVTARARAQPGPYRATHRVDQGGEVRVLQHHMQSIAGNGGRPQRLLGFVTDVTIEHELEKRMQRANAQQSIGLLAGSIVHDLNNAFSVIAGHADLGQQAAVRGEPINPVHLEAIQRAAESAKTLTRRLLSLGREEALVPRQFDPAELLERVGAMALATLGSCRTVSLDVEQASIDVVADPAGLERLLVDLVVNAGDALPPDTGRVVIACRGMTLGDDHEQVTEGTLAPGLYAEVSVTDDGCGMDEETLDRAFEPFFSTKPNSEGSGVGLASANAFAQRSGGSLAVESTVGSGTRVGLYLPAVDASQARPGARPPARRVLIAVAEDGRCSSLADRLAGVGMQTVRAGSATTARTVLETEPIDLLVADAELGATVERAPIWRSQHRGVTALVLLAPPGWSRPVDVTAVVLADVAGAEMVANLVENLLSVDA